MEQLHRIRHDRFARGRVALVLLLASVGVGAANDGELLWARRAGGTLSDSGGDVAAFANGSMVVVGQFYGSATFGAGEANETTVVSANTSQDVFVARYNPDGTLAWAKRAGGSSDDQGIRVAAYPDGSAVVTGAFQGTATFGQGETNATTLVSQGGRDVFVARYNSDGTVAWAKRAGGTGLEDYGNGVAPLADGSALVTGWFQGTANLGAGEANAITLVSAGQTDIFVARFNADGTVAWAKRAGGSSFDDARGVGTLADGSSVVTGSFYGTATFGSGETNAATLVSVGQSDAFVARYNADGTLAWAKRAGGSSWDSPINVAASPDGSSVVTGSYIGTTQFGVGEPNATTLSFGGGSDAFVARYNADGTLAWAKRAGAAGGDTYDQGTGVAILADGSAVVGGEFRGAAQFGAGEPGATTLTSTGMSDVFVARYNPNGTLAWARRAGGASFDNGARVTALADGSVVITGQFAATATFGAGEANSTSLVSAGGVDIFLARYAGPVVLLEIAAPENIVQECGDGDAHGVVNFVFDVSGAPSATAVLTVRDITNGRLLLEQAAAAGQFGVGPYAFPMGGSVVVIEIIDEGDVLASASLTVQVEDSVPPVISGCGPKELECQGPTTTLYRSLLGITAADACDPNPTVTFAPPVLGIGTTSVEVTARDDTGNASSCTFDVTVLDTMPPFFTVRPADVERECEGAAGTVVSFDVVAEDLCAAVTVSCRDEENNPVDPAGTVFGIGTHTVVCTATDSSGNMASCSFEVRIVDNTSPVIVCPADITAGTEPGECFAFVDFTVTATDLCDPTVPVVCEGPWGLVQSGDAFPVGTTAILCTARDHSGNEATCEFNITVQDREPPALACPESITLVTDCAGSPVAVTPSNLGIVATDNCDPGPSVVCSPANVGPGITSVTCTATDDSGNESSCSVAVTVLKGPFECRFHRPLDGNVDNLVHPGRTVPIKVRVSCNNVFEAGATAMIDEVFQIDGAGTPIGNELVEDAGASSDNGPLMRLQASDEFYIYNLSTASWPATKGARFRVTVRVVRQGHLDTICEVVLRNK